MTPADQIHYEARQRGQTALAIFSQWNAPVGAGTEMEAHNACVFFHGLLVGEGIECGLYAAQFTAGGVLVFIPVGDMDRDLIALLHSHPCGLDALRRELPLHGLTPEMFNNLIAGSVAIPSGARN